MMIGRNTLASSHATYIKAARLILLCLTLTMVSSGPATRVLQPIDPGLCSKGCAAMLRQLSNVYQFSNAATALEGCQFACDITQLVDPIYQQCSTSYSKRRILQDNTVDLRLGCEIGRDMLLTNYVSLSDGFGFRCSAKDASAELVEVLPQGKFCPKPVIVDDECVSCCKSLKKKFDQDFNRYDVDSCISACSTHEPCYVPVGGVYIPDKSFDHRQKLGCSIAVDFLNFQSVIFSHFDAKNNFLFTNYICNKGDVVDPALTSSPTKFPTNRPTIPTFSPTKKPTFSPTLSPTNKPTSVLKVSPTSSPSTFQDGGKNEGNNGENNGNKIGGLDLGMFIGILLTIIAFCALCVFGLLGALIYQRKNKERRIIEDAVIIKGIEKSEANRLSVAKELNNKNQKRVSSNKPGFAKFTSASSLKNRYLSTWMFNQKQPINIPENMKLSEEGTDRDTLQTAVTKDSVRAITGYETKLGPKNVDVRITAVSSDDNNNNNLDELEAVVEEEQNNAELLKFPSEMPLANVYKKATKHSTMQSPKPPPKISAKYQKPESLNQLYETEDEEEEEGEDNENMSEHGNDKNRQTAPVPPPKVQKDMFSETL